MILNKIKSILEFIFPYAKIWLNSLPNNGPYSSFVKWFELEEGLVPILMMVIPFMAFYSVIQSFWNGEFLKGVLVFIFFYFLFNGITFCLVKFRLTKPLTEKQLDFVKKVALKLNLPLPTNKMVKKDLKPYLEAYFEYDRNKKFL